MLSVVGVIGGAVELPAALQLFRDRLLPLPEVELVDVLALGLLAADEHPIQMGDFPQFGVHRLPSVEDQLEFGEQVFELITVLLVVLQEVEGLFNHDSVVLQRLGEGIQFDEPLIGVLNGAILVFLADGLVQVEAIHVSVGTDELGVFELDGEVLVAVDPAAVRLRHSLLLNLLENGIAVWNGRDEGSVDYQVRKNGHESPVETFRRVEHVVKAELSRNDVVEGVLDLVVEILGGEILHDCMQSVRLFRISPSLLVGPDALLAEVDGHHVGHSGQFPLGDVLTSTAADVQHVQQFVIASLLQIQTLLHLLAHQLGLRLNQHCLDPVVEGLQLVGATRLALQSIIRILRFLIVVSSDVAIIHQDLLFKLQFQIYFF